MREIAIAALVALGACTEHGKSPGDARHDGPNGFPDAAGPCGTQGLLSGELIDLDSKPTAFLGVGGATLTLPGSASVLVTTSPDGRFDLCTPFGDPVKLSLDAPAPYLDGAIVIDRSALHSLHALSLRAITSARAQTFYASRGLTFDAAKAHVLVFEAGDRDTLSLDRTHGAPQAGNDDASPGTFVWSAGESGRYVLYPNVDVAQPTATVTGGQVPVVVPLAAGQLTLVAVSIVFI